MKFSPLPRINARLTLVLSGRIPRRLRLPILLGMLLSTPTLWAKQTGTSSDLEARLKEVESALRKPWPQHCMLTGSVVHFRSARKSKRKFRLTVSAISLPWREAENGFASCA